MKHNKKEDFSRIRRVFATAYREKENVDVGELWQVRTMGRINDLDPLYPDTHFFALFQRLLWRLAPVAFVLALLLGAAVARLDFIPDYELAKLLTEDPTELSLLTLYNG